MPETVEVDEVVGGSGLQVASSSNHPVQVLPLCQPQLVSSNINSLILHITVTPLFPLVFFSQKPNLTASSLVAVGSNPTHQENGLLSPIEKIINFFLAKQ